MLGVLLLTQVPASVLMALVDADYRFAAFTIWASNEALAYGGATASFMLLLTFAAIAKGLNPRKLGFRVGRSVDNVDKNDRPSPQAMNPQSEPETLADAATEPQRALVIKPNPMDEFNLGCQAFYQQLEDKPIQELEQMAEDSGVADSSQMSKAELIEVLIEML